MTECPASWSFGRGDPATTCNGQATSRGAGPERAGRLGQAASRPVPCPRDQARATRAPRPLRARWLPRIPGAGTKQPGGTCARERKAARRLPQSGPARAAPASLGPQLAGEPRKGAHCRRPGGAQLGVTDWARHEVWQRPRSRSRRPSASKCIACPPRRFASCLPRTSSSKDFSCRLERLHLSPACPTPIRSSTLRSAWRLLVHSLALRVGGARGGHSVLSERRESARVRVRQRRAERPRFSGVLFQ